MATLKLLLFGAVWHSPEIGELSRPFSMLAILGPSFAEAKVISSFLISVGNAGLSSNAPLAAQIPVVKSSVSPNSIPDGALDDGSQVCALLPFSFCFWTFFHF